jgi:hypothetical protein
MKIDEGVQKMVSLETEDPAVLNAAQQKLEDLKRMIVHM